MPYAAFIQIRNESEHKFAGLRSACSRGGGGSLQHCGTSRGRAIQQPTLVPHTLQPLDLNISVVRESRNKYLVSNNSTTNYQFAACIADAQPKLN